MDRFIIDRQFGQAIWVEVIKGIVKRCYNESPKFNKKMNEVYKGKSITFLKTDFESRMKPIYHNVRPEAIISSLQKIASAKSRIKQKWNLISMIDKINFVGNDADTKTKKTLLESERIRLKAEIDEIIIEQSGYEKEFETEKIRLLKEHNYTCNLSN